MAAIEARRNAPPEPSETSSGVPSAGPVEEGKMEGMQMGAADEEESFDRYAEKVGLHVLAMGRVLIYSQRPSRSGSKDFADFRADAMARVVDENAEKVSRLFAVRAEC